MRSNLAGNPSADMHDDNRRERQAQRAAMQARSVATVAP